MLSHIVVATLGLILVVCLVVEILKRSFRYPSRWVPVVSLIVGVSMGIAIQPISGLNLLDMLLAGLIIGLSASGLFDLCKRITVSKKD